MRKTTLLKLRKARHLTQAEVAEALDLSQSMVSKYERDLLVIDIHVAAKFAAFYEVSLDYLFGESNGRYHEINEDDIINLSEEEKTAMLLNILKYIKPKK